MKTTLEQWVDYGWLRPHQTSKEEIGNLLSVVERSLKDAAGNISPDGRFMMAYNASLSLCSILLYSQGYRPAKASLHHYRTIAALPLILGEDKKKDAEYLNACRAKRNKAEYDYAGAASGADADELVDFAVSLKEEISSWLKSEHPELI